MTTTVGTSDAPANATAHPYYRVSALAFGFVRMFRAFLPLLAVVVVNAVIQGLLAWGNPAPVLSSAGFLIGALFSLICIWLTLAWITAAALAACEGRARFRDVLTVLRGHLPRYLAWTALVGVLALVGWMLFRNPSLVVLAVTPFVALAALDAGGNPLVVNFRVIGRRFLRWLITVIIVGVLCVVLYLLSAFNTFFIGGAAGAAFAWLAFGVITAWWFTAFALIYRSALADTAARVSPSTPPSGS